MTIHSKEFTVTEHSDGTFTILVNTENTSIKMKYDNVDMLYRFIRDLLKGDRV